MSRHFSPGSFYDNIDTATKILGLKQPGVIWALASVPWDSITDRNDFLNQLVARDYREIVQPNEGGV